MRAIHLLIAFVCVALCVAACDAEDDAIDEEPPAEQPAELDEAPEDGADDSEDELDLFGLIDQQIAVCEELICDRPFDCHEDVGGDEPQGSPEECKEIFCGVAREVLEEMEPTDELERCLRADATATDCLQATSCEDFLDFVTSDIGDSEVCAEEMAAQHEACSSIWARIDERRMERMSE